MSNLRASKKQRNKREARRKKKKKSSYYLPDDIWRKILDIGIKSSKLNYKDLCSVSLTCKRLHRLSTDDSLWSQLLFSDFPFRRRPRSVFSMSFLWFGSSSSCHLSSSSSAKSSYKVKFVEQREVDRKREEFYHYLYERLSIFDFKDRFVEIIEQRKAEEEKIAALLSKIEEIELAETNQRRKPTAAQYFNLPEVKRSQFECAPDRRHPRDTEKSRKVFRWQRKC